MHISALSCGLLFHSEPPLSSNPPMRFGPGFLWCGHTGLAPPTPDSSPNTFLASRAPSDTCTCPHATLWGTQCPHLCHALHTGDLGHALTNMGPSEPKKHIAMLVLSQAAEETWISCHTAGTGPVLLESLALDRLAFSSSEGLQTQPVSCFTWISFILSDGASISMLLPVAFNLCPQGELLSTQFKVLTGTGTADLDTGADPAATETRAELPTSTAALSTVCRRMTAHNTLVL